MRGLSIESAFIRILPIGTRDRFFVKKNFKLKNLTAEVAEHAEVEMAKSPALGCRGKSGPFLLSSRKINTEKRLSGNDLCALCLLFVHPIVFNLGGLKGKEGPMFAE